MTKKISYADAKYIFNCKKSNPIERFICNITLTDGTQGGGCFRLVSKVKLPYFLLMYLLIAVCQFFYCLWDGGLKDFRFMTNDDRIVSNRLEYFSSNEDSIYQRMLKVWEKA